MTEEDILSLPIDLSMDSVPSSKGLPMCCHTEMAEPLSPSGMLHITEHVLGDKAATATWLHDSPVMGPWEIQTTLLRSGIGVYLAVQSQFLQLLESSLYWNVFLFPESMCEKSPISSSELLKFVVTGNNHWDVAAFDVACWRKTTLPRQQSTLPISAWHQGNLQMVTTLWSLRVDGMRIWLKAFQWHFIA